MNEKPEEMSYTEFWVEKIVQERTEKLQAENAALRARVARLQAVVDLLKEYQQWDTRIIEALKALEAGGEGGE